MKKIQKIGCMLVWLALCWLPVAHAQNYAGLWKQVEQAQKKSLPQTVIKLTDEIYRLGEQEQNAGQMLKAYLCREAYQKRVTPDSLYVNLKHMERWAESEKNPVNKAILHSLLAREYADLMRRNRRALLSRTPLDVDAGEVPGDVREWSICQFVERIDRHARASLQDSVRLLEASTEGYVPFTVLGDDSRFYRHDMYHLLAGRAVSAYQALDGFRVDSLQSLRIRSVYEQMVDIYRHRAGAEGAVVLCTLDYWEWKNGVLSNAPYQVREGRKAQQNEAYLRMLNGLIEEYGNCEVCAEVYIKKVSYLRAGVAGRSVAEALKVCDEGLKRYPSYKRISELRNIRAEILQPQLGMTVCESGYPGDSADVNVNFRNLSGFTLNLYATTLPEVPWMAPKKCVRRKIASRHFDLKPLPGRDKLPEDVPYLSTDTVCKFGIPQEPGVYILQVVPDGGVARAEERFLAVTRFKVLTLDLGDGRKEFVTLDASTGQPIADAKLSFYASSDKWERTLLTEVVTDADGRAVLTWQEGIRSYVARKKGDTAMMRQTVYMNRSYDRPKEVAREVVALLTDRSIYRPGQTVHVKGIAYRQGDDSARVVEGADYDLVLLDANHKELASTTVRTNDFGSFTTEFVLPAACLNGLFSVRVQKTYSTATFRVEEYKRPTFEVTFASVSAAYRLGDKVMLKGNVKAFNGMTVQNVPLAYTVTRRYPWPGVRNDADGPLLADTVRLDANGDFAIPLTLDGRLKDEGRYGNVCTFLIEATVTDEAGETQTASFDLMAGPKAYSFDIRIPQYLCKEDSMSFTWGVNNIMSVPQHVKGTCRLYSVMEQEGTDEAGAAKPVWEGEFTANQLQNCTAWKRLPSGKYRLELSVRDSLGREESSKEYGGSCFLLFSKEDKRPAAFTRFFYHKENEEFDAEHPASFLLGTSYRDAYVLMDIFCDGKRIESSTLQLNDTLLRMEYPYKEAYGEGVTMLFNFVKNGQMYGQQIFLKKRKPERMLDMKWEVFRDRLRPGQEEEWRLVVKTPQGAPAAAEVLATMYDASLDKIYSNRQLLEVYYPSKLRGAYRNASNSGNSYLSLYFPLKPWKTPVWAFDRFYSPYQGVEELMEAAMTIDEVAMDGAFVTGYGTPRGLAGARGVQYKSATAKVMNSVEAAPEVSEIKYVPVNVEEDAALDGEPEDGAIPAEQTLQPLADLRTNFAETAFFYPLLRTNEQGEVAFSFIMPQSLTRWNFRGYSHTKEMMTGMLDASAVTAKEFMLTPNMPRYVRTGDKTQIAGTVANLTGKAVKATVPFTLFDPVTEQVLSTQRRKFTVDAGKTTAVEFGFEVTSRYNNLLGVRMVADGGTFSDGEQHLLPVLSNKEYITETLAMPIRGEETRTFALDSLFNRNSRTATDRRLTVEFTGNPAWYAVQALPVLSLLTNDNAVSWATAWYANSLAGFIANSQPRIKAVFDSWKATGGAKKGFLSQLEKNQDVKNILLGESPWVLEATTEAERKARIATLFDINQLNNRHLSAFAKLKELQGEDGGWSWYKGMSGSRYITGYVTELLVRLPLLTEGELPEEVAAMRRKAFGYLNREALEEYRNLRKAEKKGARITHNSSAAMTYLYLIALSGEKVPAENQAAHRYFLSKVPANLKDGSVSSKAQSAIVLKAAGRSAEANEFIASLKEHLVQTDEMGAHFAFHDTPYNWGMLPIPAHVDAMEALRMVGGNDALVEEMKLWLLKQKQATGWNSPVATADAVYALLCQGSDLLESRGDVRITLGNQTLSTLLLREGGVSEGGDGSEPLALGYLKETFTNESPVLKAQSVTVEKRDAGIAWGAVYAQYLSPISDVRQQGGALSVEKKLYVERVSADGANSLQPVAEGTRLAVGDKIVARLTIRLDRAMDFVQLKDRRGACFEPIGALSGYRWSNGFGYYTEVEDAGTNFFFDHLGKGVYVLEHSYRIARGGTYETGLATIQCAYAPEYASHSAGGTIVIK
ncbi:MAG: alpha-2-macroglobulin [Bacteroides sp.]|nr:alpha-2-macroglobulin [Bacteroides sp.]